MAETSLSDVVKRLKSEGQLTRNTGTNSIKTIKEILVENQQSSLQDKENAREQAVMQDKQLQLMEKMAGNTANLGASLGGGSATGASGGGFLSGLLGGAGLGGGALLAGLGILAGGGGYLLKQIQEMDAKKIVQNVKDLLSIGDSFRGGNWGFLLEGGPFTLAMVGIGAGLAAFSVGAGVTAAVQYFEQPGWTTRVKENVLELLSIADEIELGSVGLLFKGATFGLAMSGIGAGLAVFGAGSAIAGLSDSLVRFTGGDEWAKNIKNSVITLMSIGNELGGSAAFVGSSAAFLLSMTGIAAGLAVFGAGSAVGGVGVGLADAIAKFTGEDNFASLIKSRVSTLLSIKDDLGGAAAAFGEAGTFLGIMTGLAAGLAVFGAGSVVAGVGAGLSDAIAKFSGREGDFAVKIKDQVATLISITDLLSDGGADTSKAGMFAAGMGKIAFGLAAFGTGNLVGTLANVGTAILGFFGVGNPFDQIMQIADQSDKLLNGATALERISNALNAFSNIRVSDIDLDFEKLALNLGRAVPFLDALANGGEVEGSGGWFSSPIIFPKGLLDPSLRLDELAAASAQVNAILGGGSPSSARMETTAERVNTAINSAQTQANAAQDTAAAAAATTNATVGVDASTRINQRSETVYVETDMSARDPWSNGDYIAP